MMLELAGVYDATPTQDPVGAVNAAFEPGGGIPLRVAVDWSQRPDGWLAEAWRGSRDPVAMVLLLARARALNAAWRALTAMGKSAGRRVPETKRRVLSHETFAHRAAYTLIQRASLLPGSPTRAVVLAFWAHEIRRAVPEPPTLADLLATRRAA